jgi:2-keto-4-pentenoate hydratase
MGSIPTVTNDDLVNPLIKKGMTAQLATRRTRIAAGERPLGWKVGLGSPTMRQKLGLQAPVVGYA